MAKKKKKDKSLKSSRNKRRFQSSKLEERIKKSQEQSQGRSKNIIKNELDIPTWRPKDGSHIIDVIPYSAGKLDPNVKKGDPTHTYEYWAHVRVGPASNMFICPTEMFNKPCPICEHRQKLREANDDRATELFPKRRNLYNIISYDRGEENKGIQVWDVSYHYFEKLVMAIARKKSRKGDRDKITNFVDERDGKSINFTIEPAKTKNDYPSFVGHAFDDRDYIIDKKTLDQAFTLDEIVYVPTYEEIETAYWGEGGQARKKKKREVEEEGEESKLDVLLEELDELEDMEELEEFMRDHAIEIKIKKKDDEESVKEKIVKALKEAFEDEEEDDEDEEDDDDDDEDEEDDEEDDDDDDEDESKYTVKQIRKMKKSKLKKLIKEEELDVDIDDAEDEEELQDMVIEELELEED